MDEWSHEMDGRLHPAFRGNSSEARRRPALFTITVW